MTDLVTFLGARLDEDEAGADADASPPPGYYNAERVARGTRMLAEVDAKRRVLAEHAVVDPDDEWAHCRVCRNHERHDAADAPCRTLRLLALPFAGHPDYDESWAP